MLSQNLRDGSGNLYLKTGNWKDVSLARTCGFEDPKPRPVQGFWL
jgi:hypothetical protein